MRPPERRWVARPLHTSIAEWRRISRRLATIPGAIQSSETRRQRCSSSHMFGSFCRTRFVYCLWWMNESEKEGESQVRRAGCSRKKKKKTVWSSIFCSFGCLWTFLNLAVVTTLSSRVLSTVSCFRRLTEAAFAVRLLINTWAGASEESVRRYGLWCGRTVHSKRILNCFAS